MCPDAANQVRLPGSVYNMTEIERVSELHVLPITIGCYSSASHVFARQCTITLQTYCIFQSLKLALKMHRMGVFVKWKTKSTLFAEGD